MKQHFLFTLALLISFQSSAQALTEKYMSSQIKKVVAYNGQAVITREVDLDDLVPGDYQIIIDNLPKTLNNDTLRVTGSGSANVSIHNVQVSPLPQNIESKSVYIIKQQIEELEQLILSTENQLEVAEISEEFLNEVQKISNRKIQSQIKEVILSAQQWQKTLDFIKSNLIYTLEQQRTKRYQKKKFQNSLRKLRRSLNKALKDDKSKKQGATVYFTVKQAGQLKLQLHYLINQVNWTPSYEANLSEKESLVRLNYFGNVIQRTGENWNDIDIKLSTSSPLINAKVPILDPWIVTNSLPGSRQRNMRNVMNAPALSSASEMLRSDVEKEEEGFSFSQSEIQTQGLSVLFSIPHKISIESATSARKVAIASRSFKYKPEYHIVPKLSSYAFLKATFANSSNIPLLAGKIRNYVDLDYTGTSKLPLVRPGERASLNFGIDPNIKVQRKELKNDKFPDGVLRDRIKRTFAYEMLVTNFKPKPQKVIVWDHLPVSKNPKISINIKQMNPTPTLKLKNNIFKWILTLKPLEKKRIYIEYDLTYPKDMNVYSNFTNKQEMLRPQQKRIKNYYRKF